MKLNSFLFLIHFTCFFSLMFGCNTSQDKASSQTAFNLVDPDATELTRALYANLRRIAPEKVLFGHQNTNLYGVHWHGHESRSDVYDVTGAFPAVYGYDFLNITNGLVGLETHGLTIENFVQWSKWAIGKGSMVTFSWHGANLATMESFYDRTPAVHRILPGGDRHDLFLEQLDLIAEFSRALSPLPFVFRPFHEHNGDWFWWGKGHCTEEQYIALWRFTVEYLRDVKGVDNVLYAFSPDRSRMEMENFREDYFYGYPGDDVVDIFGLDNYWDARVAEDSEDEVRKLELLSRSLDLLVEVAEERNKLPAFTETGLEGQVDPNWWTERLLAAIKSSERSSRIAWVLVWRNANAVKDQKDHFYAPYPGHPAAADFIRFRNDPMIAFEGDVDGLYEFGGLR
jgi:mannan endo-1,4-beta-mannosidase